MCHLPLQLLHVRGSIPIFQECYKFANVVRAIEPMFPPNFQFEHNNATNINAKYSLVTKKKNYKTIRLYPIDIIILW